MNISDTLTDKPVSDLDLSRYVAVDRDASIEDVVAGMNEGRRSCALVTDGSGLAGIFTQRDVLERVVGNPDANSRPVESAMTPDPRTILPTASVADGMAVMTEMWVRSVPVVTDDGKLEGNLSFYTIMRLVSELLAQKASLTESELSAQHGLMFVDFTGLHMAPAVKVSPDDTVDLAVHQMRSRAQGMLLVTDEREHVVGTLSEFDLQVKVACRRSDIDRIPVREVMSIEPMTLSVRSPVAAAVAGMAENEVSHVALVGESGRLVGMASFRDIADYFESSLVALG